MGTGCTPIFDDACHHPRLEAAADQDPPRGATGLVGSHTLQLLLADPRVTEVVALTRSLIAPHIKLLNPIVDNSTLPLDAAWWAIDGAICALGTTRAQAGSTEAFRAIDHDYALTIATQVRNGGARRFALTSSLGANPRSRLLYPRTKANSKRPFAA